MINCMAISRGDPSPFQQLQRSVPTQAHWIEIASCFVGVNKLKGCSTLWAVEDMCCICISEPTETLGIGLVSDFDDQDNVDA